MLAPMEGVTEPAFREVVIELHRPDVLGGAFTEFVVVPRNAPVPEHVLRKHLGRTTFGTPVGMQLMGSNPDTMAETARRVEALGVVPVLDINFGCPAKGALKTCSGSAALRDPVAMEAVIRQVSDAVSAIPVTV
jgi:tRNA-dihydrouridine synthase C